MKTIQKLFLLLGVVSCVSCNNTSMPINPTNRAKTSVKEDKDVYEKLVGDWEWIYSDGGIANLHQTPQSTSSTQFVYFDANKNFTMTHNAETAFRFAYTLSTEKYGDKEYQALKPLKAESAEYESIVEFQGSDTLILTDPPYYADGMTHTYLRKH